MCIIITMVKSAIFKPTPLPYIDDTSVPFNIGDGEGWGRYHVIIDQVNGIRLGM